MAIRTTADLVRSIISDVPVTVDLTQYIVVANHTVDQNCLDSEYSDDTLELIERYLAAHYIAGDRRRTQQESVGSGAVMEGLDRIKVDLGFDNTWYGQMAMRLDVDGNLAALNNTMKDIKKTLPSGSGVSWIGYDPLCRGYTE